MTLNDDWGFKVDCTGLWVSGRCHRQSQTVAFLDKVVDSMELIDFLGWRKYTGSFWRREVGLACGIDQFPSLMDAWQAFGDEQWVVLLGCLNSGWSPNKQTKLGALVCLFD